MTAETSEWTETKHRIQERWPGLDEADIDASEGDRDALVALLQGRLGYAKSNAEQDLDQILAGETIIPKDVADERVHTGTSGPVGPSSPTTPTPTTPPTTPTPATTPAPRTPPTTPTPAATDFTRGTMSTLNRASNMSDASSGEGGELPNQPSESTGPSGPGYNPGGGGGSSMGGGGDWGNDPWDQMRGSNGRRIPMIVPPKVLAIVGAVGTLLVAGILLKRRRDHHRSKTEQVTDQARHLLEEITERMPSVEELRDKVRSLDELREKKMAAARR